jgi:rhodanese-related sulfurtransferase
MEAQRVSAEEARRLYLRGEAVLVDARATEAYERSGEHIPGDIRIPPDRAEIFKDILPEGRTIVVYCTSPDEHWSMRVAQLLLASGWRDARVVAGGFAAWQDASGPVSAKVNLATGP